MIPFRSLTLQLDRQLLNTEARIGISFSTRKIYSLQGLQQVLATKNCVRLQFDQGKKNEYLLERFITELGLDQTLIKSHPQYSKLCQHGLIAF